MDNEQIAAVLAKIGTYLELEGASFFRIRAYRDAADIIYNHDEEMADMLKDGKKLTELPSIGKDLAAKVVELVETGKLAYIEELETRIPPTLLDILQIPGLGPKRVRQLFEELDIRTLDDLQRAGEKGVLRELPRFGQKLEEAVLRRIVRLREKSDK